MDSIASDTWVQARVEFAMEEWWRAGGAWQRTGPVYSARQQGLREKAYDRALEDVRRACRKRTADAEQRLTRAFARFAAEALDLGPDAIELLTHGFLPVGKQLARWARRFDASLSHGDITQAARNAWTACGMQPLFGARLRLTGSILGYSLLYPYSDNYLDQRAVTHDDKVRFSRRFRARLRGDALHAAGPHERSIWELVRLIEMEFPRRAFPAVFDALLAIHAAQEESVRQLEQCGGLEERELLRISCAKGGTSVLADACLVRGRLTRQEGEFGFLWGVLLQLGDDLQDVVEDLERGSDTLFTRAVRSGMRLDGLVARLLNFSECVGARMEALPHGDATHNDLLRMSWRSLILMAVGQAQAYFSAGFLARMEPCSPFRFEFLRARREKLEGERGLFERIFELVLNSEEEGGIELPPAPELVSRPFDAEGKALRCDAVVASDG